MRSLINHATKIELFNAEAKEIGLSEAEIEEIKTAAKIVWEKSPHNSYFDMLEHSLLLARMNKTSKLYSKISAAEDMFEALDNLENDDGSIPWHAWDLVQKALTKAKGKTMASPTTAENLSVVLSYGLTVSLVDTALRENRHNREFRYQVECALNLSNGGRYIIYREISRDNRPCNNDFFACGNDLDGLIKRAAQHIEDNRPQWRAF